MQTVLKPEANPVNRIIVLAVLILVILFLPYVIWWLKAAMILPLFMLAGTYRVSKIREDKFQSQLFVGFVPLKPKKCNLPGVMYIETKYNSGGDIPDALPVAGPFQQLMETMLDVSAPTFGGAYEIWLVTAKGREIPAWEGTSQQQFEANVALLKANSGAEVRGRSI